MTEAGSHVRPWVRVAHRGIAWSAKTGVAALYIPTCLGFLARRSLVAEITTHFVGLYLMFAVFGLVVCLAYRRWAFTGLAAILVIAHGAAVAPWHMSGTSPPADVTANLRLLNTNVLTSNTRYGDVLELVKAERPDVIFVQELDSAWETALHSLETEYPYNVRIPRPDNFGMALYSRLPLNGAVHNDLAQSGIPGIRADLLLNGRKVTLYNVHTMPPSTRRKFELRNNHLAAMGKFVHQQDDLVVIAGDFNTAMWSPYYKEMIRETGLSNTRKGFGTIPTWPAYYPLLKIPLDHCLVTPEIEVVDVRRGPHVGSDHLPLIVDLLVPAPAAETD